MIKFGMTDAELDTIIRAAWSIYFPTRDCVATWNIGSSDRAIARYALSFAKLAAEERDAFMLALSRAESALEIERDKTRAFLKTSHDH